MSPTKQATDSAQSGAETSYPLEKIRVVLLEGVHPHAAELLSGAGYSVETLDHGLEGDALVEAAADAHLIGIRSKTRITRAFLEQARRLWAIGCFCIGSDQVDLEAAADQGVAVFNAPFSNTRSVAELTISEIIALHRRLFEKSSALHAGKWTKSASGAHEIRTRTLGIVGYGRIGSQVSVLAESMGMNVIYYDVAHVLPLGNARAASSLEDLLRRSDVVTIHVPDTEDTRLLIGERELSCMKPGAFLINNARGTVVDIDALAKALRKERIAGAAVDVFPQEPRSGGESFSSPLQGLDSVILTPHVGGSTEEAQERIGVEVAEKLIKLMNNGSTTTAINVPEVELPVLREEAHRILHFHHNVPGVLSNLHKAIADLGVNVLAEYLQSNNRHGYVIMDIEPGSDDDIKRGLATIPETIRVRTLW